MSEDSQEVLARFHRALVREILASNSEYLSAPFSVAEIYQNLIPYRTHREELGVEMNADYEHALLQLLAGEGDYLTIESRTARQEIREELDSANPNTGLYRDFAAADVRLNPEMVDEALVSIQEGETEGTEFVTQHAFGAEELMAVEESAEEEEGVEEGGGEDETPVWAGETGAVEDDSESSDQDQLPEELDSQELPLEVTDQESTDAGPEDVEEAPQEEEVEAEVEEAAVETSEEAETHAPSDDTTPETCPWCRENLPRRPGVSFCPFCGSNVKLVPCPNCGEELEINWRFCVACGTEVAS